MQNWDSVSGISELVLGVFASRRPIMGASRVRGDRGGFVRMGRRLAKMKTAVEALGEQQAMLEMHTTL